MKAETVRHFYNALCREAHEIATHPTLCRQQLFNRLQWEGPDVVARLNESLNSTVTPRPFLRTRIRYRESQFLVRTLAGHTGGVDCCAIAPLKVVAISGAEDYSLCAWDIATGELLWQNRKNAGPITSCAVSKDGAFAISGDAVGTLSRWDLETGLLVSSVQVGETTLYGCDSHPNNELIAVACSDGVIRLVDLIASQVTLELSGHKDAVHDCNFTPDGETLISVGEDGSLRYWATRSGLQIGEPLKPRTHHSLRSSAISSSGRFIATLNDRSTVTVWDFHSRDVIRELYKDAGHHPFYWAAPGRSGVIGCAFHPSEKLVVGAAYDRSIVVWDINSGEEIARLSGHTGWVKDVGITDDGRSLVSAGTDETLLIWDLSDLEAVKSSVTSKHYQPTKGCAFSPDGWRAVSTSEDKSFTVWNVNDNTEIANFPGYHYNDVLDCAIHPDGTLVVTTSSDNTLVVHDVSTNAKLKALNGHDVLEYPYFGVFACSFSHAGKLLASAGGDKTVRIWDTETWAVIGTLEGHGDRVFDCAISASGTFIISAGFDSTVRIWDTESQRELTVLRGNRGPTLCCSISPDDGLILAGGGGGTLSRDFKLRLWDAQTGSQYGLLSGHTGAVQSCVFTRDAMHALSVSEDGTLRVWEIASLRNVATFFLAGNAYCVDVHPHLPLVACGDHGGNVFFLDLVGIEQGSICVTPVPTSEGLIIRCPACRRVSRSDSRWLGEVRTCGNPQCGLEHRVNSFISKV